jgi:hypothetical protein
LFNWSDQTWIDNNSGSDEILSMISDIEEGNLRMGEARKQNLVMERH